MHGLILVDGPDCAGKTTLCENIIAASAERGVKAVRHHLGKKVKGTAWQEDHDAIISYIQEMTMNKSIVIADRHFLSEAVYGRTYRDGSEYPYAMRYMDMLFNRFNALKVICCPPVEVVVEKHREMQGVRHEEYKSGMDKVASEFQRLWHGKVFPNSYPGTDYLHQLQITGGVQDKSRWYHYDYTKTDVHEFARYLLDELAQEYRLNPTSRHFCFNGTPGRQSVLLVGDKMSSLNGLGIPFFSNSGSSEFLAKQLHEMMIPAERLCIININDFANHTTVKSLVQLCGRTVVMGREAERTMRQHDIPFDAYVRHPQHARRFNHNDDTYLNELRQAMEGK